MTHQTDAEPAELDPATRDLLLEAATLAPSVHNSQPWRFAVRPGAIEVHADISRHLDVSDAPGRSLLISCGAALFNLRVAADHLGLRPRTRVLPRHDPSHVATVFFGAGEGSTSGPLRDLYPSIARRRTNRFPFFSRRLDWSLVSRLVEAVTLEGALMRVYQDPDEVSHIVDVLHDAETEESSSPAFAEERARWVGSQQPGEGIPSSSLGPRPTDPRTPFRDLGGAGAEPEGLERPPAPFEPAPTVAVLSTHADTPRDWIRAGQALERALLLATDHGVSASFMNHPLEHPDLRWLVRSPATGMGHPQMIMRLGYGIPVPPTPRRPIADVLLDR